MRRAQDTAGPTCHALVNLAYGAISGPRDGSSRLESALDELMDTGAYSIVIPSDNSNPSRCHGSMTVDHDAILVRADQPERAEFHRNMLSGEYAQAECRCMRRAADGFIERMDPTRRHRRVFARWRYAMQRRASGPQRARRWAYDARRAGAGRFIERRLADSAPKSRAFEVNAVYYSTQQASVCRVQSTQPRT